MSRSGYSDDCSGAELNLWRGAVNQAIKGKRGQAFLRETLAALDEMPDKSLTTDSLHEPALGEFCTLGVVGAARSMDLKPLEYVERGGIARAFGISEALAAEIMFENDERYDDFTWATVEICGPVRPCYPDYGRHERTRRIDNRNQAEARWIRMRAWVDSRIVKEAA